MIYVICLLLRPIKDYRLYIDKMHIKKINHPIHIPGEIYPFRLSSSSSNNLRSVFSVRILQITESRRDIREIARSTLKRNSRIQDSGK